MNAMLLKLFSTRILKRVYLERLGEPLIYNLVSIFYFIFGSFEQKIKYDLVPRQPYAFGLLHAFKLAKGEGVEKLLLVEFGVAAGAGLFNMSFIAKKLSKIFDVDYEVIGFDSGEGMPRAVDYRDHPEKYRQGDYPPSPLLRKLPERTKIYYGDVHVGLNQFFSEMSDQNFCIGFISIDVDYYSSTLKCFELFELPAKNFLATCPIYFDDINNIDHNEFCGELLAIKEFNESQPDERKLAPMNQLRNWRIFKNALWLDQMYFFHVFDHHRRKVDTWARARKAVLTNPYLDNVL